MAADGVTGRHPNITEDAWHAFVERCAGTLDIGPGTLVFQAACGAGSLLYPLYENGYAVGGLDPSDRLIRLADEWMPEGRWSVADPAALDPGEAWHVVLAAGHLAALTQPDAARGLVARMVAKATHAVALVDLDDAAVDRAMLVRALAEAGVRGIQVDEEGPGGVPGRFNLFARV